VLDVPVHVPAVKESTALGAAVCAGVGAGVYASLADVARLMRFERTFEPDAGASAAYVTLYEQWRDVYDRVLQISEDGAVRPLWRAAGT
jgi:autoinducer 2 (AI-2) kinase